MLDPFGSVAETAVETAMDVDDDVIRLAEIVVGAGAGSFGGVAYSVDGERHKTRRLGKLIRKMVVTVFASSAAKGIQYSDVFGSS